MRLFVAIDLDEEVRQAAAALGSRLSRRLADLRPAPRIGWVTPDRMHLTLRFIGHVDDRLAEAIQGALAPPFTARRFEIELAGLGTFPPGRPARVIWIGVGRGQDCLAALHDDVERRLASFDLERDDRPFAAHLTLGRVREPSAAVRTVVEQERFAPKSSRVVEVTLYESRLSPRGPSYEPLLRVPLS